MDFMYEDSLVFVLAFCTLRTYTGDQDWPVRPHRSIAALLPTAPPAENFQLSEN